MSRKDTIKRLRSKIDALENPSDWNTPISAEAQLKADSIKREEARFVAGMAASCALEQSGGSRMVEYLARRAKERQDAKTAAMMTETATLCNDISLFPRQWKAINESASKVLYQGGRWKPPAFSKPL